MAKSAVLNTLQDRIVRNLSHSIENTEKQEFLHPALLDSINQMVLCNSRKRLEGPGRGACRKDALGSKEVRKQQFEYQI